MRGNTKVVIAARNVGDSNDGGDYFEGEVNDALRWLIQYIAKTTLARRIDIAVGRDLGEVYNRVMSGRATRAIEEDALLAEAEALMSRSAEPTDDPEDTYSGPV